MNYHPFSSWPHELPSVTLGYTKLPFCDKKKSPYALSVSDIRMDGKVVTCQACDQFDKKFPKITSL